MGMRKGSSSVNCAPKYDLFRRGCGEEDVSMKMLTESSRSLGKYVLFSGFREEVVRVGRGCFVE